MEWTQKQWEPVKEQQNPEAWLSQTWAPEKEAKEQQERLDGWLSREWDPTKEQDQSQDLDGPEIER